MIESLRVLLVEDCEADAILMVRALSRAGFAVDWQIADSASQFDALLAQGAWDVVIADYSMPQFGAMAALIRLHQQGLDLPFIAVSGVVGEEVAVEAMRSGAHDFIGKSNLARLAPAVRREVRAARERDRLKGDAAPPGGFRQDASHLNARPSEWFLPLALASSLTLFVGLMVKLLIDAIWPGLPALGAALLMLGIAGPAAAWSLYLLMAHRRALMQRMIAEFVEKRRLNEMQRRLADRTRELEGNLKERQRHEGHLRAQHATTRILALADTVEGGFAAVRACVMDTFHWESGQFLSTETEDSSLAPASFLPEDPAAASRTCLPGECVRALSTRVMALGHGLWATDLRTDDAVKHMEPSPETPFRSAVAIPVRASGVILGTLVFASSELRSLDREMMDVLEDIGNQIGQFVERRRAQDELRRAHEELEIRVQRRTAELASLNEALSRSEANLRQAQQIAQVGSFEVHLPFSRSLGNYWSEEARRITGIDAVHTDLSMEDFVAMHAHPEDRARVQAELDRIPRSHQPVECEHRVTRPDGVTRYVRLFAEPSLDVDGVCRKLVGTLHDHTERKELERQLLEISENEQRRIGQDLHDDLCQHLTGIEFMNQALEDRLQQDGHEEAGLARQVGDLVRGAINQTRGLARGLSPVQVESLGLIAALEDLAANIHTVFQVTCELRMDSSVEIRSVVAATHLYRITQEAINNAIRHGKADRIRIELERRDDFARLRVTDTGCGFAAGATPAKPVAGLGLRIMHYRAGMIGASLHLAPADTGGVMVECLFRLDL
ncbi:MAG: PAS domain-containing protein [Verrucomicrobia bacterium]|nr:PAS domain-containing protein [Verrucomicrobiota bacterium]MBI3870660.1 PAS domain-containing protein [Verrucomicrobiota bacterium]